MRLKLAGLSTRAAGERRSGRPVIVAGNASWPGGKLPGNQ